MDVDLASLHKILKDPTRRNIVLLLSRKGQLAYMQLMNLLEITNTGRFNYHLKILADLIEKGEDGKYRLSERGQLAYQLLQKFPEKTAEAKPLGMGDVLLIGIVGFILLFAFPGMYWITGLFLLVGFLGLIFELLVPGAVMWWLTVRRTRRHDLYDLFKPPLVPLALIIACLILLLLLRVSFTPISANGSYAQPFMLGFLALGFYPFIGVGVAEALHRVSKRR
jgi:hypothetical protein